MAASDDQLELVIRAVDEASATLNKVRSEVGQFASGTSNDLAKVDQQSRSLAVGFNQYIQAFASGATLRGMAGELGTAVTAANDLQTAMMGLSVAAAANSQDLAKTEAAAQSLAANGLMTVSDAATGLRNLLATGFNLQQSVDIMQRATDVAAFYRQGSLSVGDAVRGMTEGIKNGNEAIADNAGMTTNLTTLIVRQGGAMTDLQNLSSDATARMRLYNGIMQDTAASTGNAARYTQTFAGQQQQLGQTITTTQQRIGQIAQAIGGPLIQGLNQFLSTNQQAVVSMIIAGGVAVSFAALIVGLAAAAAIAVAVLGGPLTVALLAISALLGGVVFAAMQKFQDKMKGAFSDFSSGAQGVAQQSRQNFDSASKDAAKLADQLAKISESVQKANRDFAQSLAEILKTSQDKIKSLTDQINDEKTSFSQAQQDKADAFAQSQADQLRSHQDTVDSIKRQLDDEMAKGRFADVARLQDLHARLDQENRDYQISNQEKVDAYNKDLANAKTQSDKKLAGLQTQLDEETAFMIKHTQDLKNIRTADALDQIDKLKQSHQDQLHALDEQKKDAIKNAHETTAGMAANFNQLPNMISPGLLNGIGKDLGKSMAIALRDSFVQAWADMVNGIGNFFGDALMRMVKNSPNPFKGNINPTSFLHNLGVPGFATGGVVPGAVGQPQLILAHGGEVVTPPGERFGGNANNIPAPSGGNNVTIYNSIYNQLDWTQAMADMGWALRG